MWKRKPIRATFGLGLLLLSLFPQPSWGSSFGSACDEYDSDIHVAVTRWWPDLPIWKLWRAQIYAESQCDTNAVSSVSAQGLTQLMPGTAKDLAKRLGLDPMTSPHVAKFAIPAGASYMAQLRGVWHRDRQPLDAHWLGVASYNRGAGNIIHDQAECNGARLWPQISPCTSKHTPETPAYVSRIQRYWQQMESQK